MKIDFVSDVACPWCAVGLSSLQIALERLGDRAQVELHFQPFELNPHMASEGEDIVEHLARKYQISPEQIAQNQGSLKARGAAVGFAFGQRDRIYNTFDAHRLLYWAGQESAARELALKTALLQAYHGRGENVGDHAVLARVAGEAGLDAARAAQILASDEFAADVRARERFYQEQGIHSVPSIIIDERYLISGGQPPEVFEATLRRILDEAPNEAGAPA